jgi:hypothetical protein
MAQQVIVRRDTNAWNFQVWASFALAVFLCGLGIINMPSERLDRAFLALGYFFCLSSAFVLSKTVRDNQSERVDTQAWVFQVWAAFGIAMILTAWGLAIRDRHEADLLEGGAGEAGTSGSAPATPDA